MSTPGANEVTNVVPDLAVILDYYKITGPLLQVLATLSLICSGLVFFTGVFFYRTLAKKKLYMKIIMMVSLCDVLGSFGSMMGYPSNKGFCTLQGSLIFFFYRAAWMWATSISFSLYCQVVKGRLLLSFKTISIIIWTISIVLELLPMINGLSYGNCYRFAPTLNEATTFGTLSADGSGSNDVNAFKKWVAFTFVFPLAVNLTIMLTCHSFISCKMVPSLKSSGSPTCLKILKCLRTAQVYPILMLCCWVPHVTVFILVNNVASMQKYAYLLIEFSFAWGSFMGFWLFILYFSRSVESRKLWSLYLYGEESSYHPKQSLRGKGNPGGFGRSDKFADSMYERDSSDQRTSTTSYIDKIDCRNSNVSDISELVMQKTSEGGENIPRLRGGSSRDVNTGLSVVGEGSVNDDSVNGFSYISSGSSQISDGSMISAISSPTTCGTGGENWEERGQGEQEQKRWVVNLSDVNVTSFNSRVSDYRDNSGNNMNIKANAAEQQVQLSNGCDFEDDDAYYEVPTDGWDGSSVNSVLSSAITVNTSSPVHTFNNRTSTSASSITGRGSTIEMGIV